MKLHTKEGKPLVVSDNIIYTKSGKAVGKINGNTVTGPNGNYVGTIVHDRLVYRSSDSSVKGSEFSADPKTESRVSKRRDSYIRGDEPKIS